MTALEILRQYFGYDHFRNGQGELISHILQGEDVFGIMPTGAGKSVCYQIPAMLMSGMTLVISPLISLMQDQVNALQANGIPAEFLNSTLDGETCRAVLRRIYRGEVKILYTAPERLETPSLLNIAKEIPISMITVDEVHCVSQWGQDFRPSYLHILPFMNHLPHRPVISVFTATATKEVASDVVHILNLHQPFLLKTGFDRENLYFSVQQPRDKFQALLQFLQSHAEESGIIYCISRKLVEQVTEDLNRAGFPAVRYHAGLAEEERRTNQNRFIYDQVRLMVATNAFGMGIDKSDVSFVVHYNMPKNLESYYQEAGRAGRDGSQAECVLFYDSSDMRINEFLIQHGNDNPQIDIQTRERLQQKDKQRLKIMQKYCTGSGCLRKYILSYFGDNAPEYCGNCSFCRTNCEQKEITLEAQKIISCIYYLHQKEIYFHDKALTKILRGSRAEAFRFAENLSTYGILKDISEKECLEIIRFLVSTGLLSEKEHAALHLNRNAALFLKEKKKLFMPVRKAPFSSDSGQIHRKYAHIDKTLLELLRKCRNQIAKKEGVPAYIIFTDITLQDMCRKRPVSDMAFLSVSGVGRVKLEKYGDMFMEVIRNY